MIDEVICCQNRHLLIFNKIRMCPWIIIICFTIHSTSWILGYVKLTRYDCQYPGLFNTHPIRKLWCVTFAIKHDNLLITGICLTTNSFILPMTLCMKCTQLDGRHASFSLFECIYELFQGKVVVDETNHFVFFCFSRINWKNNVDEYAGTFAEIQTYLLIKC